jgi:hypothetical protein
LGGEFVEFGEAADHAAEEVGGGVAAAAVVAAATSAAWLATSVFQSCSVTSPDWPTRMSSMPITALQCVERRTAGSRVRASLALDTIAALAPESPRICAWSRSVLVT